MRFVAGDSWARGAGKMATTTHTQKGAARAPDVVQEHHVAAVRRAEERAQPLLAMARGSTRGSPDGAEGALLVEAQPAVPACLNSFGDPRSGHSKAAALLWQRAEWLETSALPDEARAAPRATSRDRA